MKEAGSGYGEHDLKSSHIIKHNRLKLVQQNQKLRAEIYKLEQLIDGLITSNASQEFSSQEESKQTEERFRAQKQHQLALMAKLRRQIKKKRVEQAEHHNDQLRHEEDQVVYLKREAEKLIDEREVLAKRKQQKMEALELVKPINTQIKQTLEQYKRAKAENGSLKQQVLEREKEVAKYHKVKEMAKTSAPPVTELTQELSQINFEQDKMRRQVRRVDEKWRGQIDAMDREFISMREALTDAKQRIVGLERELKGAENRNSAMREEAAIAMDKQRISSVTISAQKRQEMQALLQDEKDRRNRADQFRNKNKPKGNNSVVSPTPPPVKTTQQPQKKEEESPTRAWTQPDPPSPSKAMQDAAVGTSFYYNSGDEGQEEDKEQVKQPQAQAQSKHSDKQPSKHSQKHSQRHSEKPPESQHSSHKEQSQHRSAGRQ